ncbi:alpha/beta hydrolase [Paenisporosarcina cavernae]|uniref:Esterase family protein n=1 Tax=Paenisporosarcina cavernae TaxID=2320858 RepID=A0A385YRD4_9BACL|nr:alpha/beta hydrolase-fold protein [Paenisporosarcina cavernae]AYC29041.1 esterase family protein [Paenisporosarcina cavernae]
MNKGTLEDITLFSDALQEDMQLLIYKPATYSPLYKYSVLFVSDGKDYFQLGRLSRVADELLENKEIENLIIVGIPYKNVQDRLKKYHPEGEQHEAFLRFLAHELVPYIDTHFPTYQIGMGRALMGDSLAGTVSLLAASKYPNIFGKVIMHSPMVNDYVKEVVRGVRTPHAFSVYHVIGKEETAVETTRGETADFLTPNRELHEIMLEKGFQTFYEEFDGNHTWKFWQPDMKRAIEMNFGL